MSVEICPVCGGKGLVPNGFYVAVGTSYYSTNSTISETCRSCGGKGYIETYSGIVQHPQLAELEELNERLKKLEELADTASIQQSTAKTLNIAQKCCANCKYIEGGTMYMMYMSNPPKFKCVLHQCWYEWSEMNSRSCDDWEKNEEDEWNTLYL